MLAHSSRYTANKPSTKFRNLVLAVRPLPAGAARVQPGAGGRVEAVIGSGMPSFRLLQAVLASVLSGCNMCLF